MLEGRSSYFFLVFVQSFMQILGGIRPVGDQSNLTALATS